MILDKSKNILCNICLKKEILFALEFFFQINAFGRKKYIPIYIHVWTKLLKPDMHFKKINRYYRI